MSLKARPPRVPRPVPKSPSIPKPIQQRDFEEARGAFWRQAQRVGEMGGHPGFLARSDDKVEQASRFLDQQVKRGQKAVAGVAEDAVDQFEQGKKKLNKLVR